MVPVAVYLAGYAVVLLGTALVLCAGRECCSRACSRAAPVCTPRPVTGPLSIESIATAKRLALAHPGVLTLREAGHITHDQPQVCASWDGSVDVYFRKTANVRPSVVLIKVDLATGHTSFMRMR